MKICIATNGPGLDSLVSRTFARAPYFVIFDLEKEDSQSFVNPGIQAGRGAGVAAAQLALSKRAGIVICGNLGPNAFHVLQMSDIKIYPGGDGMTALEAIAKYKKGEMREAASPTTSSGFGAGLGRERRFTSRGSKMYRRWRR